MPKGAHTPIEVSKSPNVFKVTVNYSEAKCRTKFHCLTQNFKVPHTTGCVGLGSLNDLLAYLQEESKQVEVSGHKGTTKAIQLTWTKEDILKIDLVS